LLTTIYEYTRQSSNKTAMFANLRASLTDVAKCDSSEITARCGSAGQKTPPRGTVSGFHATSFAAVRPPVVLLQICSKAGAAAASFRLAHARSQPTSEISFDLPTYPSCRIHLPLLPCRPPANPPPGTAAPPASRLASPHNDLVAAWLHRGSDFHQRFAVTMHSIRCTEAASSTGKESRHRSAVSSSCSVLLVRWAAPKV
jgi:hypothetical protein